MPSRQRGRTEPGADEPGGAQPGDAEPGGAHLRSTRPGSGQPGGARPGSGQPGGARPGNGQPGGARPGAEGRVELLGDADRPGAWMLLVGGVPQSHVDLDDPRHLELEYMRRFGHLIDLAAPAGTPLRVLHLGGGGLTLARYVAATRPGSSQLAVESVAEVAELVRRRLPLDQLPDQVLDRQRSQQQPTAGANAVIMTNTYIHVLADSGQAEENPNGSS